MFKNILAFFTHCNVLISFLVIFVVLQISYSPLHATPILIENVTECAKGILKTFNGQSYGDQRIWESDTSAFSVGRIKFDKRFDQHKATIVFRGARGLMENYNCIQCGNEFIHKGFLNSYRKFDDQLFQHIDTYASANEIELADMHFVVGGHSRGSAFVSLVVENLVNKEVPLYAIAGITFSPLPIFAPEKTREYNEAVGERHINFLAREDIISQWVDWGHKWAQKFSCDCFSMQETSTYQTVGKTISFDAREFHQFNEFVEKYPYRYLMPVAFPVKWALTPEQWGAHQIDAYKICAPKVYEQYLATEQ